MGRGRPSHHGHLGCIRPLHEEGALLALVLGATERARLREALRGRAIVHFVETVRECERFLAQRTEPVRAIIVEPRDRDARSTESLVRDARQSCPSVSLVGYCRVGAEHSADIRAMALAGVHELIFRDVDDTGIALRAVLDAAEQANAGEQVALGLRAILPGTLWSFSAQVVTYPVASASVSAVAAALGLHRKTLVNRCAQAHVPPPQELLAWCRLALVGHLLATTRRTIQAIALDLEFASDTALRNMFKRYTGLRASEVRARGGAGCVLDALQTAIARFRVQHADAG
jgi:AraC-like DNA-binding protein